MFCYDIVTGCFHRYCSGSIARSTQYQWNSSKNVVNITYEFIRRTVKIIKTTNTCVYYGIYRWSCLASHIGVQTKWSAFCRRYRMHFLDRKYAYFDSNFTEIYTVPKSLNNNKSSFQIMAWQWTDGKQLPEPMVPYLRYICVAGHRGVNS